MVDGATDIEQRLEMLLVLQWLDDDRPADGGVWLSIATTSAELDMEGSEGLLAVMGALSAMEEAGRVQVTWPRGPGAEARVMLAQGIRDDAGRLFGDR